MFHAFFMQRLEPYAMGNTARLNGHPDVKSNSGGNLSNLADDGTKASSGRLLISQNCDPVKETKSFGRLSVSQNLELQRDSRTLTSMLFIFFFFNTFFVCVNLLAWYLVSRFFYFLPFC